MPSLKPKVKQKKKQITKHELKWLGSVARVWTGEQADKAKKWKLVPERELI